MIRLTVGLGLVDLVTVDTAVLTVTGMVQVEEVVILGVAEPHMKVLEVAVALLRLKHLT